MEGARQVLGSITKLGTDLEDILTEWHPPNATVVE
jgi:hypothetical protein